MKNMKDIEVNWCPHNGPNHIERNHMDILAFEPEPLLKHVISMRSKDTEYLKCPAFRDYCKNTFVMKSPIDYSLEVVDDGEKKFLKSMHQDQKFFDEFVLSKFVEDRQKQKGPLNDTCTLFEFNFGTLVYSKESVIVEQIPSSFAKNTWHHNINLIPARFDISKWIRPFVCAYEIFDDKIPIVIRRGDPLFYMRFVTERNVKLKRVNFNEDLDYLMKNCLSRKDFESNSTMEENYEAAKPLINLKDNIFKTCHMK